MADNEGVGLNCVWDFPDAIDWRGDPPVLLPLDEQESTISITSGSIHGQNTLRGKVGFTGGHCPLSSCEIALEWVSFDVDHFPLEWHGSPIVRMVWIFGALENRPVAQVAPDGTFQVPGDQMELATKFRYRVVGGTEHYGGGIASGKPSDMGSGRLDFQSRRFEFQGTLSQDGQTVALTLVAYWQNLPPLVRAWAESPVVECDAPGTGTVHLSGDVSDPDGAAEPYFFWVIDGQLVAESTLDTEQHLSLGDHRITLWAVDDDGGWSSSELEVSVVDTTPPVIGPGPGEIYCAWPPNHKYVKLDIDEQVLAYDACDPSPTVVFLDGISTEPDNDLGDGDTTEDVLVYRDAVCLRSERSGIEDGRRYTVTVAAVDSSGNSGDGSFDVLINHDQAGQPCRALPPSTFVAPGQEEERCPPDGTFEWAQASDRSSDSSGSGAGCSTGSGPEPTSLCWWLLAGLLLTAARRRRR